MSKAFSVLLLWLGLALCTLGSFMLAIPFFSATITIADTLFGIFLLFYGVGNAVLGIGILKYVEIDDN